MAKSPVAAGRRQGVVARMHGAQLLAPQREGRGGDDVERGRGRKQEALPGDAAELQELCHLFVDLDALGHRLEAKRLTEHHDRASELRTLGRLGQAADE